MKVGLYDHGPCVPVPFGSARAKPKEEWSRAAAALGLGMIGSPEARAALELAKHDEDPVVRSNVNRALRHEE